MICKSTPLLALTALLAALALQPRAALAAAPPIVGVWHVTVESADFPPFQALQAYHRDGTYTDTTDILGTLSEGPGLGVWRRMGSEYVVTFELFAFEEDGSPAGTVRVHNTVRNVGRSSFEGTGTVDFVTPDGMLLEGVGSATFTGERLKVKRNR
jgi:hypothetical protein